MPGLIHRAILNRAAKCTLRRMAKQGTLSKEHAAFCRTVANSPAMLAKLADRINQHAQKTEAFSAPPKEYPLLRWLWEHRQEILDFVLQIVKLFSS